MTGLFRQLLWEAHVASDGVGYLGSLNRGTFTFTNLDREGMGLDRKGTVTFPVEVKHGWVG